ncbi:MAG: hypothetical protein CMK98_07850 [Pseudomonas sp.]|nr:hypothetical protein [Pseudomonas sp.]
MLFSIMLSVGCWFGCDPIASVQIIKIYLLEFIPADPYDPVSVGHKIGCIGRLVIPLAGYVLDNEIQVM